CGDLEPADVPGLDVMGVAVPDPRAVVPRVAVTGLRRDLEGLEQLVTDPRADPEGVRLLDGVGDLVLVILHGVGAVPGVLVVRGPVEVRLERLLALRDEDAAISGVADLLARLRAGVEQGIGHGDDPGARRCGRNEQSAPENGGPRESDHACAYAVHGVPP